MIYEYSIDGATLRQCIEAMPPSTINFTIPESAMEAWQDDYADMRRFFIYGESLEFEALMQRIEKLQKRVKMMQKYVYTLNLSETFKVNNFTYNKKFVISVNH